MFDLTHGFLFLLLGMTLTVLGFGIAFYFGSKQQPEEEELNEAQKSIQKLYDKGR
jgi:hypothetical protein